MTRVAFIVNGGFESAMGHRAREIASRLSQSYDVRIVYRSHRKILSVCSVFAFLVRARPAVSYVFDIGYTGVLATFFYKLIFRNRLIVETGDAIYELAQSSGSRGALGLWLTWLLEEFALRIADRIVVRGSFHREWLAARGIEADVIQDGVDTHQFAPESVSDLRKQCGLERVLTVGLVGASVWSERLQMCYGWELVEALRLLRNRPVKGIIIGDGSGITRLKARCREYGIEEQILFWGYVPYEQLSTKLNLIDVCLSTQTNDLVGQVRTTGKLPLYLAAGRYVLASEVGEAALVLAPEMLLKYEGVKDEQYPNKLAEKILALLDHPEKLKRSVGNVAIAKKHFDYEVLVKRMATLLEKVCKNPRVKGTDTSRIGRLFSPTE